jgi:uncharacterized protein YfcZ (UPF0381/DUF406 family)
VVTPRHRATKPQQQGGERVTDLRPQQIQEGRRGMRYFFDVHNGNELTRDEVGLELDGIDEARDEAAEALAEMAGTASREANPRDFSIEVRDESNQPVLKAEISFAVQTVAA